MKMNYTTPKNIFLGFALLLLISFGHAQEKSKTRHALVIGIDGALVAGVQAAETPTIDSLLTNAAYTWDAYSGGNLDTPTEQATSSGPGWSSILTGVWVNKHNVPNNDFSNPNYDQYPHFFQRIKEKRGCMFLSSIVNWKPINDNILRAADYQASGHDQRVAELAAEHLLYADPEVLFLQFDEVDGAGHKYGYGVDKPNYLLALSTVDAQIGVVLSALQRRSTFDDEEWLVLITTDHGGFKKGHGGQQPSVRQIFMIASGPGVQPGSKAAGE